VEGRLRRCFIYRSYGGDGFAVEANAFVREHRLVRDHGAEPGHGRS
jgi:hypothetical protein